jgi:hypothetical protein
MAIALEGSAAQPEAANQPLFIDPGKPYLMQETLAGPYLDLDAYRLDEANLERASLENSIPEDPWYWQSLPVGLVYSPYLADTKASRFAANFVNVKDDGWLFDAELGTQVGLLRYGTSARSLPDGFQIDAEGSAQARLDMPDDLDLRSVDCRAGVPITFGVGPTRWKVGYYHISSHLGDEFLLKHPTFARLNFVRDVLVFGYTKYLTPQVRTYAEVGWAFHADVSEPWEVQFGFDYAPFGPTGIRGAPFLALNAHLREEVDFSGSLTCQAGWAWRSDTSTPLLRIGVHYFNGKSNQYSFFNDTEQQFGLAVWYDY